MKDKKGKQEVMTNEEVTGFIEERLQMLEKTGQVNDGMYDHPAEEIPSSFFNFIRKMFRDFFCKNKKGNRGNANI
ncbi:MAG: hypothetical protein PHC39_01280 [Proteiniphilum sp.]|nr:hypothetical protein [Proteiniphilum sp.]MDD3908816.1 hypothetical protein [Proteiniphilum sp.]